MTPTGLFVVSLPCIAALGWWLAGRLTLQPRHSPRPSLHKTDRLLHKPPSTAQKVGRP